MSVPIISTGQQVLTGKNVLGLILAGGSSQRLGGGDKSLRPL
ncbi:molybdenum cofactor guanylyltransferase MobA, partial [Ochrobactrum sp. MR31]|nr:molybdenum cofactor guanylyltransferase MobA [Ochrobactrum sp. MR31]